MIPIIALLVLSSSFIHSVPLDPVSSMLGSAGISAAMMGGFSLYSANKQASEDRRMQMYLAK